MLAKEARKVVHFICIANGKNRIRAHLHPPVAPGIEWPLKVCAEASLRAAGAGLQLPAVGRWCGRSIGKQADSGQPRGFDGPLFSPGLAHRDCAAGSFIAWFTSGCNVQRNVTPRLEVVTNGLTARLLDSRARLCR